MHNCPAIFRIRRAARGEIQFGFEGGSETYRLCRHRAASTTFRAAYVARSEANGRGALAARSGMGGRSRRTGDFVDSMPDGGP